MATVGRLPNCEKSRLEDALELNMASLSPFNTASWQHNAGCGAGRFERIGEGHLVAFIGPVLQISPTWSLGMLNLFCTEGQVDCPLTSFI